MRAGRDCGEEVRGWGLKGRNDRTGGEESRSDGGAIIIGYENLAVTSAPLLAWLCFTSLLLLLLQNLSSSIRMLFSILSTSLEDNVAYCTLSVAFPLP